MKRQKKDRKLKDKKNFFIVGISLKSNLKSLFFLLSRKERKTITNDENWGTLLQHPEQDDDGSVLDGDDRRREEGERIQLLLRRNREGRSLRETEDVGRDQLECWVESGKQSV